MSVLAKIYSRQILDSRSIPTLETVAILHSGHIGVASVPSGSSVGSYEARELRDNDPSRYLGNSVFQAVANVNTTIAQEIVGKEVSDVFGIERTLQQLDGTPNKSRLGANALLSVSLAIAKSLASENHLPLYTYFATQATNSHPLFIPTPIFNMINGGKHGSGNLDIQEFHIIPARREAFATSLERGATVYIALKKLLARRGSIHSVGHEGGFAPNLFTNTDALQVLSEAVTQCHYSVPEDIEFSLDVAANSFYKDGTYSIKDQTDPMSTDLFITYLLDLSSKYKLRLIEDPLFEDDWPAWSKLVSKIKVTPTIVGDDLLVTNPERVKTAIAQKACSAIIVKPNQIGSLWETLEVIKQARAANWKIIVSHRSGETNDTCIADFAVGVGADYTKFGAPARGERVAKYNRLLAIETELSSSI